MATMSIRIPNSLHETVKELADLEGVSMNQFIAIAVAEKTSAYKAERYFRKRAARASKKAFERVLDAVPDVPPLEEDRLED